MLQSLPAWGAWVEIRGRYRYEHQEERRSPHGERGLKYLKIHGSQKSSYVAPRMGSVG